jgi:hypothetical protein
MAKSRSSKRGQGFTPVREAAEDSSPEDTPEEPPEAPEEPPEAPPEPPPKPELVVAKKPRVVRVLPVREITCKEWRAGRSGLWEAFYTCELLLHPKQNRKCTRADWDAEFEDWKARPR